MGLLIVTIVHCDITQQITGQIHWADYLLDELNLTGRDAIFGIQILIRPALGPVLRRHEGIDLSRGVLGWLMQQNQQACQSA